jgi:hypothetical protein
VPKSAGDDTLTVALLTGAPFTPRTVPRTVPVCTPCAKAVDYRERGDDQAHGADLELHHHHASLGKSCDRSCEREPVTGWACGQARERPRLVV